MGQVLARSETFRAGTGGGAGARTLTTRKVCVCLAMMPCRIKGLGRGVGLRQVWSNKEEAPHHVTSDGLRAQVRNTESAGGQGGSGLAGACARVGAEANGRTMVTVGLTAMACRGGCRT